MKFILMMVIGLSIGLVCDMIFYNLGKNYIAKPSMIIIGQICYEANWQPPTCKQLHKKPFDNR